MNAGADVTFYAQGSSTAVSPDASGDCTLANSTTYYCDLLVVPNGVPTVVGNEALLVTVHWRWNAALVAAITYELSNFPDAALNAAASTGPNWQDSGSAAVSPASAASGVVAVINNEGATRMRAKVVVTTGGKLRGRPSYKGLR